MHRVLFFSILRALASDTLFVGPRLSHHRAARCDESWRAPPKIVYLTSPSQPDSRGHPRAHCRRVPNPCTEEEQLPRLDSSPGHANPRPRQRAVGSAPSESKSAGRQKRHRSGSFPQWASEDMPAGRMQSGGVQVANKQCRGQPGFVWGGGQKRCIMWEETSRVSQCFFSSTAQYVVRS